MIKTLNNFSSKEGEVSKTFYIGETTRGQCVEKENMRTRDSVNGKEDSKARFQNALAMSPKLEFLFVTS